MTEEQINSVLSKIAGIADLDELKLIEFSEIHEKIDINSVEIEKILYYLAGEKYINELPKVINKNVDIIQITHLGIKKCLTSNQEKQIDLVLSKIAEIADSNESKSIFLALPE